MTTSTQESSTKRYTPTCPLWCTSKCRSKYPDFRDVFHRSEAATVEGTNGASVRDTAGFYAEVCAPSHEDGTPKAPVVCIPMDCLSGMPSSIEAASLDEVDELIASFEDVVDKLYDWRKFVKEAQTALSSTADE